MCLPTSWKLVGPGMMLSTGSCRLQRGVLKAECQSQRYCKGWDLRAACGWGPRESREAVTIQPPHPQVPHLTQLIVDEKYLKEIVSVFSVCTDMFAACSLNY